MTPSITNLHSALAAFGKRRGGGHYKCTGCERAFREGTGGGVTPLIESCRRPLNAGQQHSTGCLSRVALLDNNACHDLELLLTNLPGTVFAQAE